MIHISSYTFTLGVFYDRHAGCMPAAYAGLSGVINAASCQSI